jgi:hypothetical protein
MNSRFSLVHCMLVLFFGIPDVLPQVLFTTTLKFRLSNGGNLVTC